MFFQIADPVAITVTGFRSVRLTSITGAPKIDSRLVRLSWIVSPAFVEPRRAMSEPPPRLISRPRAPYD